MTDAERIAMLEQRVALLEARLASLGSVIPSYSCGWTCQSCGVWVPANTYHACWSPLRYDGSPWTEVIVSECLPGPVIS